jgi:hypothetical protein
LAFRLGTDGYLTQGQIFVSDANATGRTGPFTSGGSTTYAYAVAISPDGGRVAYLHERRTCCAGGSIFYTTVDLGSVAANNTDDRSVITGTGIENPPLDLVAWSQDGLLWNSSSASASGASSICLLNATGSCIRNVADDPANDLAGPAVSPAGDLVVATISPKGSDGPSSGLELFNYSTGAPVRQLTTGPDNGPAFSPDGSRIVFSRANGLYTIAASGAPGSETLLAAGGNSPTWGAAPDATPTPGPGSTPTPGTGPGGGGGGGGKRSACAGKRGTALATCRALETYNRALAKCNRMKGKGKKAAKRKTACRRKASKSYKHALALIKCDSIKQKSKRPACRRRARKAGAKT